MIQSVYSAEMTVAEHAHPVFITRHVEEYPFDDGRLVISCVECGSIKKSTYPGRANYVSTAMYMAGFSEAMHDAAKSL
jgi:hypothetical protein